MRLVHNLLIQFFALASSNNDHPSYVKHVLGCIYVFFLRVLGVWGGWSSRGLVHNQLMQFFTLDSSKIEVSETYFCDILTTHNNHPSYVKHLFGYGVRGGGVIARGRFSARWICRRQ